MNKIKSDQPIGVFDSGVGGLTVVKEIINLLPNENLVYFGDTARVPYGNKSNHIIREYSFQNTRFLLSHKIKILVIACNSASSVALNDIASRVDIPVVGVILPGALAATKNTKNNKIAVIGTYATISSKAYQKAINEINPDIAVYGKACPLFVPLVEEGWFDNQIAKLAAIEYLTPLMKNNFDTLVLGCTHYPLLKSTIQSVVGENIKLIDSGVETAHFVKKILTQKKLLNNSKLKPNIQFFVSDLPHKFKEIGEMFLGQKIEKLFKHEPWL